MTTTAAPATTAATATTVTTYTPIYPINSTPKNNATAAAPVSVSVPPHLRRYISADALLEPFTHDHHFVIHTDTKTKHVLMVSHGLLNERELAKLKQADDDFEKPPSLNKCIVSQPYNMLEIKRSSTHVMVSTMCLTTQVMWPDARELEDIDDVVGGSRDRPVIAIFDAKNEITVPPFVCMPRYPKHLLPSLSGRAAARAAAL